MKFEWIGKNIEPIIGLFTWHNGYCSPYIGFCGSGDESSLKVQNIIIKFVETPGEFIYWIFTHFLRITIKAETHPAIDPIVYCISITDPYFLLHFAEYCAFASHILWVWNYIQFIVQFKCECTFLFQGHLFKALQCLTGPFAGGGFFLINPFESVQNLIII